MSTRAHQIAGQRGADDELSWVVPVYQSPKAFNGGTIRISDPRNPRNVQTHEPLLNEIIFYPSSYTLDIDPVQTTASHFGGTLFVLHGRVPRS